MASKLERFTKRARRVLQLAQEEAEQMSHNYGGTEHVLIGLTREEKGIAGNVLRKLGATPERVKLLVYKMTGSGKNMLRSGSLTGGPLDLTPSTKQVIEFAVDEARKLTHSYISTEHLLLATIRQSDGIAIDVLRGIGLKNEQIRRDVMEAIATGMPEDTSQDKSPFSPAEPYTDKLNSKDNEGRAYRRGKSSG